MSISSYKAKVYRAPMDVPAVHHGPDGLSLPDGGSPWCASFPWWPSGAHADMLRSSDGFHRTYACCQEGAMRFVDWKLLNDPVRLRAWAEHYGYTPVIDRLDGKVER